MKVLLATSILILSTTCLGSSAWAQNTSTGSPSGTQPDNSKVNKADRGGAQPTAEKQLTKADRQLAEAVRKSIIADKGLSTYAHNIKVVVSDGTVTLRGPVRSDEEKAKVGDLAQNAPNVRSVDNQITVKPK